MPSIKPNIEPLKVINIEKLQETAEKVIVEIELNTGEAGIAYKTMDNLAVFPENDPILVEKFAKSQAWNLEENIDIKLIMEDTLSTPMTIRTALTTIFNFTELLS